LEPRSGSKRRVLADELRDRSGDRRAGGRSRGYCVAGLVVPRKREVDVGGVEVAVVVMRCAALRSL